MPTNGRVPECTKKGYRAEDGTKISFFKFPHDIGLRKKWLHAIRRDEGKFFQITKYTKVCSRHFRESDLTTTLAGRRELRKNGIPFVPSKFAWIRTSPRKRKAPAVRENIGEASRSLFEETETDEEPENSENHMDEMETEESTLSENLKVNTETEPKTKG